MFLTIYQAEIIRGDDIDITMAERRILTLGSRTNFLTQLHSSFQVRGNSDQISLVQFHFENAFYLEQGETVLCDGISPGWRPHVPSDAGWKVQRAPESAVRCRDCPGSDAFT